MSNDETIKLFLDYEIGASRWWVGRISSPWLQQKVATYFARKVNRKYRAYQNSLAIGKLVHRYRRWSQENE